MCRYRWVSCLQKFRLRLDIHMCPQLIHLTSLLLISNPPCLVICFRKTLTVTSGTAESQSNPLQQSFYLLKPPSFPPCKCYWQPTCDTPILIQEATPQHSSQFWGRQLYIQENRFSNCGTVPVPTRSSTKAIPCLLPY